MEYFVGQGISVITAVNVQHMESLRGQVLKITGTNVTERIPDKLLKQADEVVNVDLTVGELRARLAEGRVYDPAKVPTALAHFFQAENLLQLRRLAVHEVAQLLSQQVETGAGGAPQRRPAAGLHQLERQGGQGNHPQDLAPGRPVRGRRLVHALHPDRPRNVRPHRAGHPAPQRRPASPS